MGRGARGSAGAAALVLVTTLCVGCGDSGVTSGGPGSDAGSGEDRQVDAPVPEVPQRDPEPGVRWTNVKVVEPASIATLANVQLPGYFRDGTIVVLMTFRDDLSRLRVGTGLRVDLSADDAGVPDGSVATGGEDGGLIEGSAYSFVDTFGRAGAGVAVDLDGLHFATRGDDLVFPLVFLPGETALVIHRARLEGVLDADGLPSSTGLAGRLTGCVTAASIDDACPEIEITDGLPSPPCSEMITEPPDQDCTGRGEPDGWLLELQWEANEAVSLLVVAPWSS